jgi:hypothetical protein
MREPSKLTLKIFILCFLFSGIHLATLHVAGDLYLQAGRAEVEHAPTVQDPEEAPAEAGAVRSALERHLEGRERYVLPGFLGLWAFVTLLLALSLRRAARGALKRAAAAAGKAADRRADRKEEKKARKAAEIAAAREPARPSAYPAVQVLSALQQEGRFVDFLQEDLGPYEDAQIGAAVRSVHEGCRKALAEHLELAPVFEQEEGAEVTVKKGFDARAVRLTGNVAGDPPFQGVLRHRGWRVSRLDLPIPVDELLKEKKWVLAPAEVEIEG